MKINILGIVKGGVGLLASAGAGAVVGNLVKATTPHDSTRFQKILVSVGGYTIGIVLGDLSAKYLVDQVDNLADRVSELVHPADDGTEEQEVADIVNHEAEKTVTGTQKGTGKKVTINKSEFEQSNDDGSE